MDTKNIKAKYLMIKAFGRSFNIDREWANLILAPHWHEAVSEKDQIRNEIFSKDLTQLRDLDRDMRQNFINIVLLDIFDKKVCNDLMKLYKQDLLLFIEEYRSKYNDAYAVGTDLKQKLRIGFLDTRIQDLIASDPVAMNWIMEHACKA